MADDTNISIIIIYSFFFLFIVYLFLQQGNLITKTTGTTGYALFDTTIFENLTDLSLTTLILIVVGLALLIIGGIFLYKKLKKKKEAQTNLEIPVPPQPAEKSIAELNKEFNVPQPQPVSQENVLDQDINKLFMENAEQKPQVIEQVSEEKPREETKFNLDELKQLLKSLMKKNYTKESIVKYLNNKGFNLMQIRKAIYYINEDSIANYVRNALSQGFSKQEIIKALLNSGWNKEDILKYFS